MANRPRLLAIFGLLSSFILSGVSTGEAGLANVIFSDNFNGAAAPQWSVGTVSDAATTGNSSDNSLGRYLGQFTVNGSTTLTLTGLPTHTQLELDFDLYLFQTWDGNNGTFGPDFVSLAGGVTFSKTFTNHQGCAQSGGVLTALDQSYAGFPDEIYGSLCSSDSTHVYRDLGPTGADVGFLVAHSGSTFSVTFGGPTTQTDEQWGIDNVRVSIDNVDRNHQVAEPATLVLLGTGLMGLSVMRRRRRSS